MLDWKADMTLNTSLVQSMHKQYDERRIAFQKALSSPEALAEYQNSIRNKFLQILGTLPERSPLNATVTGTIQQDGYRIEKIIYESFANHHVTANLYIPSGNKRYPAALLFCGHEDAGKATPSYQQTAILFAKNGFVVFVIDPVSQAERYQIVDEKGKPLTRGGTTEHTLLNEACNLFGSSVPAYELWDNVRGLDYLVTRPEVDTSKIGCLGNSGGGMQTIYFAGYESRVKIFAPCSYLENREQVLATTGPADGCAQLPGEGAQHLELDDYLISAAPKPLLILAGRFDFINYNGTLTAYEELKKVYAALNQQDKLKLFTFDDGHGISKPKREAAVQWFRKWFYNDDHVDIKKKDDIPSEKELFASATGNINTTYSYEETIVKRNLQLYDSLAPKRKEFISQTITEIRKSLIQLLSIDTIKNVQHEEIDTIKRGGISFRKLIIRSEGEVPLPILKIPNIYGRNIRCLLWLNDSGKAQLADSSRFYKYIDDEFLTILADTRGTGEISDKTEMNDPKYYNNEYRNAMLSLHIMKPIVGQRVSDILIILKHINSGRSNKWPVVINATGVNCIPALIASLFYDGVIHLTLYHCPESFRKILEQPTAKNWYSYVIAGVANYFDIPDLINLVGKEKISIIQ